MTTDEGAFADYWDSAFIAGIKKERLAQGMSQTELAEKMSALGYKFHQATVNKVENGDRKVSAAEAYGLADIFDVPVDQLYDWMTSSHSPEARLKRLRTQADHIFQLVLRLDQEALNLRKTHQAFAAAVEIAEHDEMTEQATVNDPEIPVGTFYKAVLDLDLHNEFLERLRTQVWVGDFAEMAGSFSGVSDLADLDSAETS
jgi:transcriptional regulator with XRE-family HTH domain